MPKLMPTGNCVLKVDYEYRFHLEYGPWFATASTFAESS